jgi:hypothetical protein
MQQRGFWSAAPARHEEVEYSVVFDMKSNAAGVAGIVADNFRHSRHIWTHPVCKTFDHRSEKKSLLSYIRPVLEGFWLPGPNGYLRSSSSSSFRPCDGLGVNQVLNEPV